MRLDGISRLVAVLAMATLTFSAGAATKTYTFTLDGLAEVPLPLTPSSAAGSASVTIDDTLGSITFFATVYGLDFSTFIGAHIHGPAAPVGVAKPVFYPLTGVIDAIGPVTIGPFIVPTSLAFAGVSKPIAVADAAAINATPSDFYLNIHTGAYPGGEVRGQLALIPEPASYALMGAGLGLVGFVLRRRARS